MSAAGAICHVIPTASEKGRKEIIAEDLQDENNSDGERPPWLTAEDFKW